MTDSGLRKHFFRRNSISEKAHWDVSVRSSLGCLLEHRSILVGLWNQTNILLDQIKHV